MPVKCLLCLSLTGQINPPILMVRVRRVWSDDYTHYTDYYECRHCGDTEERTLPAGDSSPIRNSSNVS